MYMSLNDLRQKFYTDQPFAIQFVRDAANVGITVDVLDDSGAQVDATVDSNGIVNGGKLYDDVNLLNTYVKVVKTITETDNATGKARLYDYLHAPFNEPDFTIDTNTRVITVPADFNKNGVGVVGDHLAEILFFTMPRFFDVVDLLESTTISIYWYNSGNRSAINPYYKTTPVVKYAVGDILYLGWAISELATTAAGTIEFFFEFEHINESGKVDFRLETQPAKITIKSTLSFDKDNVELDHYDDIVHSRAIYSPIINSLTAAPARITMNLFEGSIDFDNDNDDDDNATILSVDAVSPDGGKLIYQWNWNGVMVNQPSATIINNEELTDTVTYELASAKAVSFKDPAQGMFYHVTPSGSENPSAQHWYIKVDDNYIRSTDIEVNENTTYYTITATAGTTYKTLKTNVPGIYQVFIGNEHEDGSIRYVYSNITVIDPASEITIDSSALPALGYLDSWHSHNAVMTVNVSGANGNVTYQWHKVDPDDITNDTIIAGATEATFDPSNNGMNVSDPALRGYYYCVATNTKNNTVEHATSTKVMMEIQPVPVAADTITITRSLTDSDMFTVSVANRPYPTAQYKMYANVIAQVPGDNGTYDKKVIDVVSSRKLIIDGSATFSISDLTQMYSGQEFDIDVYVCPIIQAGTSYERLAERVENDSTVYAYTRAHLDGLTK